VPVIAERIGWQRGMTVLKDRVRELRPSFLPPDPVSRTVYQPGELAQCDLWFPPADLPLGFGQVGRLADVPSLLPPGDRGFPERVAGGIR
jgi:hypothetical protein